MGIVQTLKLQLAKDSVQRIREDARTAGREAGQALAEGMAPAGDAAANKILSELRKAFETQQQGIQAALSQGLITPQRAQELGQKAGAAYATALQQQIARLTQGGQGATAAALTAELTRVQQSATAAATQVGEKLATAMAPKQGAAKLADSIGQEIAQPARVGRFTDQMLEVLQRQLEAGASDIRVRLAKGLIDENGARQAGALVAQRFNEELLRGIDTLQASGAFKGDAGRDLYVGLVGQLQRVDQQALASAKAVDPIAAAMARSASGTEKFAAGLRTLEAQQRAQAAASNTTVTGLGRAVAGLEKARGALTTLAIQATATTPAVGSAVSILLSLGIGGGAVAGIAAGMSVIAGLYSKITEGARKAKDAQKELNEEADRLRKSQALEEDPAAVRGAQIGAAAREANEIARQLREAERGTGVFNKATGGVDFVVDNAKVNRLKEQLETAKQNIVAFGKELRNALAPTNEEARLTKLLQLGIASNAERARAAELIRGYHAEMERTSGVDEKSQRRRIELGQKIEALTSRDTDTLGERIRLLQQQAEVEATRSQALQQLSQLEGTLERQAADRSKTDKDRAEAAERLATVRKTLATFDIDRLDPVPRLQALTKMAAVEQLRAATLPKLRDAEREVQQQLAAGTIPIQQQGEAWQALTEAQRESGDLPFNQRPLDDRIRILTALAQRAETSAMALDGLREIEADLQRQLLATSGDAARQAEIIASLDSTQAGLNAPLAALESQGAIFRDALEHADTFAAGVKGLENNERELSRQIRAGIPILQDRIRAERELEETRRALGHTSVEGRIDFLGRAAQSPETREAAVNDLLRLQRDLTDEQHRQIEGSRTYQAIQEDLLRIAKELARVGAPATPAPVPPSAPTLGDGGASNSSLIGGLKAENGETAEERLERAKDQQKDLADFTTGLVDETTGAISASFAQILGDAERTDTVLGLFGKNFGVGMLKQLARFAGGKVVAEIAAGFEERAKSTASAAAFDAWGAAHHHAASVQHFAAAAKWGIVAGVAGGLASAAGSDGGGGGGGGSDSSKSKKDEDRKRTRIYIHGGPLDPNDQYQQDRLNDVIGDIDGDVDIISSGRPRGVLLPLSPTFAALPSVPPAMLSNTRLDDFRVGTAALERSGQSAPALASTQNPASRVPLVVELKGSGFLDLDNRDHLDMLASAMSRVSGNDIVVRRG